MADEKEPATTEAGVSPAEDTTVTEEIIEVGESPEVEERSVLAELQTLQGEVDRLKELYLRKVADFDNYRKRQERDIAEFRRLANADLLRDCLPVIDNLERALAAAPEAESGVRQGVDLVLRQLKDTLRRYGLIEIDAVGASFDPSVHEAIQRVERDDVEDHTVVEALHRGYMLGDRLLRPALVVVAVSPKRTAEPAAEGVEEPS